MKIPAVRNKTHVVFSVGHYDFRTFEDLMADGGIPNLHNYAGYRRLSGKPCWIEIPDVSMADLLNDYMTIRNDRKYGLHKIEDVHILEESEFPDINSFEWIVDNAVWKTYGKDGKSPGKYILLKDASTEHLIKIMELLAARQDVAEIECVIMDILPKREDYNYKDLCLESYQLERMNQYTMKYTTF